jgi:asparagine synthase (glutamine-hydrolysing)
VEHIHETLTVDSLIDLLPTYIEEFDEPFADSSAFPTLALARLARRHVTVALSGDGADEMHAGYHYYALLQQLARSVDWPERAKSTLHGVLRRLPWHRAKMLAGALLTTDTATLFSYMRGISKDYPRVVAADVLHSTCSVGTWFEQTASAFATDLTPPEIGMRLDTSHTLPDLFLNKVDVATMAFSLEARCPMTDYRLVEWSMRLPLHFKLRDGRTKYLLKKALRAYLPDAMIDRPKMGFGVPIAQWLRGPLRKWAHELIHDDTLMMSLPLEKHRIRELLHMHVEGRRPAHPLLWSVLMLLCFESHHRQQKPVPEPQLKAA